MSEQLVLAPEKCIDCKACMMLCSKRRFDQYDLDLSAVNVFYFPEDKASVPVMCLQCEEAVCEKVCPTHAITRGADGASTIDESRCIGCKFCVQACPMGMVIHSRNFNKIFKCDLCGGKPLCAAWCPAKAITFVDTAAGADRRKAAAGMLKAAPDSVMPPNQSSEQETAAQATSRFFNVSL